MTRAILAALAVAVVGIAVLAASVQKARAAFPTAPAGLAQLESAYRDAPHDPVTRAGLVQAYLSMKAPGAASALLERELLWTRANGGAPAVELLHLACAVEFHMGRASRALELETEAKQRCSNLPICIDIARRHALLQELVLRGIEDPIANPEESARVYQRAGRGVTFSTDGLDAP